nr:MAG TPA: hypothetical protein [Caudoviricetes sp.]
MAFSRLRLKVCRILRSQTVLRFPLKSCSYASSFLWYVLSRLLLSLRTLGLVDREGVGIDPHQLYQHDAKLQ